MSETILVGQGSNLFSTPADRWRAELLSMSADIHSLLGFMSALHHRVRNFVVTELPRTAKPLRAEEISRRLELPIEQVLDTLDDLERNLFFLVRNSEGAVCWAFPVAVEQTAHQLEFNSGERLWAA
jgi:hypothetical protein